jgi:hypothetical protein
MADYVGAKIPDVLIWKFVKNPQDKAVNKKIEDELSFDAFSIWYKVYFDDNVLSDYGDYKLRPGTPIFDLSPISKLDTVLVNGKILSPKKVELIKSLLEQYD